jgi:hypothetical protein
MATVRLLLVSAALAGGALWAPAAQALTTTQTSSSSAFTVTGNTTVTNTLGFSRFNLNTIGDDKVNVVLLGYDYILTGVNASGTISLFNNTASTINGPFNSQVVLDFDRLDANANVAFNPVSATAAGSLAPFSAANPSPPLTGSATDVVSPDPFIPLADPTPYTSPPGTPLPSLTGYSASWSYISPPGPLTGFTDSTVSGRVAVRWHYSYDIQTVPAPLPLVGAGIGFAWSRSLRRRIRGLA